MRPRRARRSTTTPVTFPSCPISSGHQELDAVARRRLRVAGSDLLDVVWRRLIGVLGALERLLEEPLDARRREREDQTGARRARVVEAVHRAARDVDEVARRPFDEPVAE